MDNDLQGDILSAEDNVDHICKKCDIELVGNVVCTSACTFSCDNYN